MQTLESIQTRHNAILRTFNQVESILAPIHTGEGKNDCINIIPFNLERLAKHSNLLNTDLLNVKIVKEPVKWPTQKDYHVEIAGKDFGYIFAVDMICTVKKEVEKSFKQVEASTKKQLKYKVKPQPVKLAEVKIIEPIKEKKTVPESKNNNWLNALYFFGSK